MHHDFLHCPACYVLLRKSLKGYLSCFSPFPQINMDFPLMSKKRDHLLVTSLRSGKRDSNAGLPASAFHVVPSVGSADSSLGEHREFESGRDPLTKKKRDHLLVTSLRSGKRDSNSRPQPWQGCALPTELFPHMRYEFLKSNPAISVTGLQR